MRKPAEPEFSRLPPHHDLTLYRIKESEACPIQRMDAQLSGEMTE